MRLSDIKYAAIFAARCYASAAYVVTRCMSVCVCHVHKFCQNE